MRRIVLKRAVPVGMLLAVAVVAAIIPVSAKAGIISVELQTNGDAVPELFTPYYRAPQDSSGPEASATAAWSGFGEVNIWNHLGVSCPTTNPPLPTDASFSSLVDSTGAKTGVALSITGANGGTFGAWNSTSGIDTVRGDYMELSGSATAVNWHLTGLAANSSYQLYFYCGVYNYDPNVGNVYLSHNLTVDTDGDGSLTDEIAVLNNSDGVLINAISSSTGELFGSVAGGTGAAWSGFHVAGMIPIPEPSSLVMAATWLFGLLAYEWRKRK